MSVLVALLCAPCIEACGSRSNREAKVARAPSSDLERFSKVVNLVERPIEVTYQIMPVGTPGGFGPTDYRLIAAVKYDSASLGRLKERARRLSPEVRSCALSERPDWFPAPLQAAMKRCSLDWCIDGERYSGDDFRKAGYVSGSFIVPEGQEFIILQLGT